MSKKWNHFGVYEALKDRSYTEKKSEKNKYIFLTPESQLRNSFAILYHPNADPHVASYPLHLQVDIEKWRGRLLPVWDLAKNWDYRNEDKKGWRWCRVENWDALAGALGLD